MWPWLFLTKPSLSHDLILKLSKERGKERLIKDSKTKYEVNVF